MNWVISFSLPILAIYFLLWPQVVYCDTIKSSCSHTPYPELCASLLTTYNLSGSSLDISPLKFRKNTLIASLDQAQQAHQLVKVMDLAKFGPLAKSAWDDCLGLYEDTVDLLNRSMSSKDPNDVLTWLSAAMTNHETCRNGFIDFNLKSHLESFPSLVSSSSKMLSNLLAINQAWATSTATKPTRGRRLLHHGFPGWVQLRDRKVINSAEGGANADLVVAQDGSGNYKTISEAVEAAAKQSGGNRFVIYVKAGVYKEKVAIKKSLRNLMIVGDGIGNTIVTGSKNANGGSTTFGSASFAVSGNGFIARDITFENTAGAGGQQAVALQSNSDHSVFYRCSFIGYQDTLYATSQRQFYRNCDIYGTVDFIFGDAAAVFQNCNIYARSGGSNYITAQGRSDPNQNTGFVIHASSVRGASKTYLGRPWKQYSRTVFAKSSLDSSIVPAGWSPWIGNFALKTLYYGEYMNTGPGAGTSGRVKWPGYHVLTSATDAGKFAVGSFLSGNSWIPSTGVPFTASI